MGHWLVLGLLLAGCGAGALLTGIVYLVQLRKIKTDLHQTAPAGSQDPQQVSNRANQESSERRSA
jgi:hypothetical protein